MGGDFDHMLVCFGEVPDELRRTFCRPRAEKIRMIEITMNCDGGHRNANPIGLD